MTRLAQAQDFKKKLTSKNIIVPHIQEIMKKLEAVPEIYNKQLTIFNDAVDKTREAVLNMNQLQRNIRNGNQPNAQKELIKIEKIVVSSAQEVLSKKKEIFSKSENVFKLLNEGANLLAQVEDVQLKTTLAKQLAEDKAMFSSILDVVSREYNDIKDSANLDIHKKVADALAEIEKNLPPASNCYIYYDQKTWHVSKLSKDEIIVLKKDNKIILKNISEEKYNTCISVAKLPKGALNSPSEFITAIMGAEYKFDAKNGAAYSETYKDSNGNSISLSAEHQEYLNILVTFNEILLQAGIKGQVTLSFGKDLSIGNITFDISAFYSVTAWAKISLKLNNFQIAAKANAEIGVKAEATFTSKEKEIGGKKFQIQVGTSFNVKGQATAQAEAVFKVAPNFDYSKIASKSLEEAGKALIDMGTEYKVGFHANAWAGISTGIAINAGILCDMNDIPTKLVYGEVELSTKMGYGCQVGAEIESSIIEEDNTYYKKEVIKFDVDFFAGGAVEITINIWSQLFAKGFETIRDYCKEQLKEELKQGILKAIPLAAKKLLIAIGSGAKEALNNLSANIGHRINVSVFNDLYIKLTESLGKHQTSVNASLDKYNSAYEIAKKELQKGRIKLQEQQNKTNPFNDALQEAQEIQAQVSKMTDNEYKAEIISILDKLKNIDTSIKSKSKLLNMLAKAQNDIIKQQLIDGLDLAIPDLKKLRQAYLNHTLNQMNENKIMLMNLDKHATIFNQNLNDYKSNELQALNEVIQQLHEILLSLPEDSSKLDNDTKKSLKAKYKYLDKGIVILDRMALSKQKLSDELNALPQNAYIQTLNAPSNIQEFNDDLNQIIVSYKTAQAELSNYLQ